MDKSLLAIGVADGSVILWNKIEWKEVKKFQSVHELPVTCIAARPLAEPFVGETDRFHARTGSLDCNSGVLSISTKASSKKRGASNGGSGLCGWLFYVVYWVLTLGLVFMALKSMFPDAQQICSQVHQAEGLEAASRCVLEEVFYISPSKLGVTLPPV